MTRRRSLALAALAGLLAGCAGAGGHGACYVLAWNVTIACWPEPEPPRPPDPPRP